MRFLSVCLSLACTLLVTSCQKEPQSDLPQNNLAGEISDGSRLKRMVYQFSANDSSYTDFQYDAAGRWTGQVSTGEDLVITDYQVLKIYRDAKGIITRYTTFEDATANPQDSTNILVAYNTSNKRYTHKLSIRELNGAQERDSTAYVYDNNGRISAERYFIKDRNTTSYFELGRTDLTYNTAGNLKTIRTLVSDITQGPTMKPVTEVNLTYDNKVSPLQLGIEGMVLDQLFFCSKNNITDIQIDDLADESESEHMKFEFTYHLSNMPKSAKFSVGSGSVNMLYRYK